MFGTNSNMFTTIPVSLHVNSWYLLLDAKYVNGGYNTSASPGNALNHCKSAPWFNAESTTIFNSKEPSTHVPYCTATLKSLVVDIGANSAPPDMINSLLACTFFMPRHSIVVPWSMPRALLAACSFDTTFLNFLMPSSMKTTVAASKSAEASLEVAAKAREAIRARGLSACRMAVSKP